MYKTNERLDKYIRILSPPKRFLMYSGIVETPALMYTGKNTQPNKSKVTIADNSHSATLQENYNKF